MSKCTNK